MAAGADKIIAFDPPGAIGLPAGDASVLLRFDESGTAIHPADAAGALADLAPVTPLTMPAGGNGACGRARLFVPGNSTGLVTTDLSAPGSLLTRDATIQAILRFDVAAQSSAGTTGTIVARGKGGSSAEYLAYALELQVVDAPSFLCAVRWLWQDTGGVPKTQTAAQFSLAPPGSAFTMLTATRRWVSPTSVLLRYYIGDVMIGEVASADGGIGGGTTGTFQVGTRFSGAAYTNFLAGAIDELLILDHEITLEEIEATWLRITRYQPLGYQLLREMHDPGFPLPTDPGSQVQMDLRMIGNALGYAAAQAENVRSNILPQRAYGPVLEDWEEVVRVTPEPLQDIDTRRARALAKIRQRRGCSILGLEDSLVGLLGGADVSQLEFLAFSNQIDDHFATIDPLRWDTAPSTASISVIAGAAALQTGVGTFLVDDQSWIRMRQTVGGDGRRAHALVKLAFTTPQSNAEAGIYFENAATGDRLLLGLRDLAGSFRVYTQQVLAGAVQANVEQAIIGANPAAIWLHLYQTAVDGTWRAAWSTASATAGYATSADITHPTVAHWSGVYVRSISALGANARADFDDHTLYMPFSGRPFNAYVLLDRALGFRPDIDGADSVISAIKHAFTHGCFITAPAFLAGDPDSGAGLGPCGGY